MAQWYVKQLSDMTGVSVQTLHHYDKIGLLSPSFRTASGYRVYTSDDLFTLQQIVALKYFGFSLSAIPGVLSKNQTLDKSLINQATVLRKKAHQLEEAASLLETVAHQTRQGSVLDWPAVVQTIEIYKMSEQLEHSWVKDIFTEDELKEYAAFEHKMKTTTDKAAFERNWEQLVDDIKANLEQNPTSEVGINIGRRCFELLNQLYGHEYAHLRTKKFEQGFGEGKGLTEVGLDNQTWLWFEKAVDAYLHAYVGEFLATIGQKSHDELILAWADVLQTIHGHDLPRRARLIETILHSERVSDSAKTWVKQVGDPLKSP